MFPFAATAMHQFTATDTAEDNASLLYKNNKLINGFEDEEIRSVSLTDGGSVELLQKHLWQKFHRHGTEMIITKIGRLVA